MPVLGNQRHELFAQGIAKGLSATDAYVAAGYKESRANASHLTAKHNIQKRVEEIQSLAAADVGLTKQWVISQLIDNATLAKASEDYGPSNKALELLGKEIGMFKDKVEHTGLVNITIAGQDAKLL